MGNKAVIAKQNQAFHEDPVVQSFKAKYDSDPNFRKMADEYFAKTGGLLDTEPADVQAAKLKAATQKGK